MSFVRRRCVSLSTSDRKGGSRVGRTIDNTAVTSLNAVYGRWSWNRCALTIEPLRSSKMIVPVICSRSSPGFLCSRHFGRVPRHVPPTRETCIPVPTMQGAPTMQHLLSRQREWLSLGEYTVILRIALIYCPSSDAQSMLCH